MQIPTLKNKCIVITRPKENTFSFKQKLEKLGAQTYAFPTIRIEENKESREVIKAIELISEYEWIVFTSVKGVKFFWETLRKQKIEHSLLQKKKIAVVGPKTAQKTRALGLQVNFMPSLYTTEQLAKEFHNIKGTKMLLARSTIASKKLIQDLQKKGAVVTDIPFYKTTYIQERDERFEVLVKENKIDYITFTSPSTVEGFLKRINGVTRLENICSIPIVSIGPVTTKAAKRAGFQNIMTADSYTTNGMIKKLQEIVYNNSV